MSEVVDNADFWLSPPHFLSCETPTLTMNDAADAKVVFSKQEFPYEFGRLKSELSSPVDSLASTESEEEDFFSELNRRLAFYEYGKVKPLDLPQPPQVPKVVGGSPQSILGGIGSWSGRSSNQSYQSPIQSPSPPVTPYQTEYDAAGLIYAAAGQVERLKMNTEGPLKPSVNGQFRVVSNTKSELNHVLPSFQNHQAVDALAEQNYLAAARRAYNAALLYEQHLHNLNHSMRNSRSLAGQLNQFPMVSIQKPQARVSTTANFLSAPLQKKASVGTGVFLPRRFNSPAPAAPPRKTGVTTSALVPPKVVQALNMSFEDMKSPSQPHYSAYAASMSQKNYESLMARRKVFLAQQQRIAARAADDFVQSNLEVCLPQEWSY